MTDVKITDLPSLTGASSTGNDVVPIVTVTSDITSKMTRSEFFKNIPAMTISGSITAGTWNGTKIGVAYGGTNITSYTIGDIVYASGATTLNKLADIATGNVLLSGGVGAAPTYGKVGLTTHVSGVLTLANGGTNAVSAGSAFANIVGYTTTVTSAGVTLLTNASTQYQSFTGTNTHTITLPVTATLALGWKFQIVNNSNKNLLVRSSGLITVATVYPSMTLTLTCIGTALTTEADWKYSYTDFNYVTSLGNAVTQLTSRTTAVTLNKLSGKITLFAAGGTAGTLASFTVNNNLVAATDLVVINISSGATADRYSIAITEVSAGSFRVQVHTIATVTGTQAPVLVFAVLKGVLG